MKKSTFSCLWQITFPLCGLGFAVLGLLTVIHLNNGSYLFRLGVTKDGLKLETAIDKQEAIEGADISVEEHNFGNDG